jgi:hypothetical protein
VSFSLPTELFVPALRYKERGLARLLPFNYQTYLFTGETAAATAAYEARAGAGVGAEAGAGAAAEHVPDAEERYLAEYRHAFFAVTRRKSGWDALRHLEVGLGHSHRRGGAHTPTGVAHTSTHAHKSSLRHSETRAHSESLARIVARSPP